MKKFQDVAAGRVKPMGEVLGRLRGKFNVHGLPEETVRRKKSFQNRIIGFSDIKKPLRASGHPPLADHLKISRMPVGFGFHVKIHSL